MPLMLLRTNKNITITFFPKKIKVPDAGEEIGPLSVNQNVKLQPLLTLKLIMGEVRLPITALRGLITGEPRTAPSPDSLPNVEVTALFDLLANLP